MPPAFPRRSLLAALPASLAACAAPRLTPPLPPRGTRLVLAPVDVARDRIIRIDVGLRPFRPAGFVVRSEMLGDKTIVHNYGHGGGGVTLSWGTAALALEQAPPVRRCAVLGWRRRPCHRPARPGARHAGNDLRRRASTGHHVQRCRRAVVAFLRL